MKPRFYKTSLRLLVVIASATHARAEATVLHCVSTATELKAALDTVPQAAEPVAVQLIAGNFPLPASLEVSVSPSTQLTISGGYQKNGAGNCVNQANDAAASVLDGLGEKGILRVKGTDNSSAIVTIRNLSFRNGSFNNGGAGIDMRFGTNSKAKITLDRLVFTGNKLVLGSGAAVYILADSGTQSIRIVSSLFADNTAPFAAAISVDGPYQTANILNNTFARNHAALSSTPNATLSLSAQQGSQTYVTNSVMWGNVTATQSDFSANSRFILSNSDIERVADSGATNANMVSEDPLFVDGGSYRTSFESVTVGSGTVMPPGGPALYDLDGELRVAPAGTVDIGAYGHDILLRSHFDY